MKNIIMVVVLAVALTAACLWFFVMRDDQAPVSEVIGGSIHRVD
jgi:RsiW-degrading membrane proteinase PrsW (M82 family)